MFYWNEIDAKIYLFYTNSETYKKRLIHLNRIFFSNDIF